ncbi:energy transducer TonB [Pseudoalteromonas pernae]|uniref:energy transducer TonB n=1 Tax=Pseudoalteromonas pernae TaxID=3118054 RepID=UPI003242FDC8
MLTKIVPLAAAILISSAVNATSDDFNSAYQQYLDAVESGSNVEEFAKQAYQLGVEKFGDNSINAANLAINYANSIKNTNKEQRKERASLYEQALDIFRNRESNEPLMQVDPLFGLAASSQNWRSAANYIDKAISLTQQTNHPKLVADSQIDAAQLLIQQYGYDRDAMIKARKYLDQAQEYYQNNVADNTIDNIKLRFNQAVNSAKLNHKNESIDHLLSVVKVFDDNFDADHPIELKAHSMLVELYERSGERDQATKHCLAIAQMSPWQDTQQQTPLYRVEPKFPISAAKRMASGNVVLNILIDEAGFVQSADVVSSEGHSDFKKEALKAVRKWRYAPKFEEGKAVQAETTVQLDFRINS